MDLIFQSIVLGVLQGLTEFLPISSSAHLILVPQLLGWDTALLNSPAFDVMLHLGTLVALLVYFWRDLLRLISAGVAAVRERHIGDDPERRLAFLLLVSVVPAALVGALFESFFDTYFRERLYLIPLILWVGAGMLWLAERYGRRERGLDRLRLSDAVAVGAAQALALFPGISRSGVTITAGLVLGLRRDDAARFSFLMGIPIIAGAGLWKSRQIIASPPPSHEFVALAAGMMAAAISGLLAIRFLLRYLRTNTTGIFIAYRVVFAAIVTVLLLAR
jgi:undecaprenyl-diphosphatase